MAQNLAITQRMVIERAKPRRSVGAFCAAAGAAFGRGWQREMVRSGVITPQATTVAASARRRRRSRRSVWLTWYTLSVILLMAVSAGAIVVRFAGIFPD